MADDLSLLKQYAETRNADAFAELASRYAGMVYGSCLRVIGNTHDAEDVAQECFLELARAAGSVETSLPGWLHLAATRRSVDAVRRSAARKRHEEQAAMKPNNNSEPTWAEIAPHVDAAIDELPEEFRLPFILHYLQGRSQAEVAGELSVDQSTVSRRIEKSISLLREHLKKAGWVISAGVLGALLADNTACAAPAAVMAALGKMAASGVGGSAGSAAGGVASATASGVLGTLKAKLIVGAIAGLAVTAGVLTQNAPEDPPEKPGDAPAEVAAPDQDAPHRPVPVEVTPELEQLLHDAMKLHVLAHPAMRDFHGRVVEIKGDNTTAYGGLGVRLSLDEPLPFDLAFNVRWAPKDFKRTYAGKKADSFTLVQGETQRDFQMPPDMIDDMLAELSSWAGRHACHRVKITLEPAPERALEDPRVKAYWPKPIELPNIELNFRVKPNLYTFASPADVAERKKELYSPDLVAKTMAAWDLSLVGFDDKQALLGVESKLVLMEAVRSDDELASRCAFERLQRKFREKIRTVLLDAAKAKPGNRKIDKEEWLKLCEQLRKSPRVQQEIMPILQKAIEGMDDPGQIGRRCSAIAGEAWALNLLDDKAKRKVVRNFVEPVFNVRPYYPAGTDHIPLWLFSQMGSSIVRCSVRIISNIDGQNTEKQPPEHYSSTFHIVNIKRPTLGPHTVRAKVEVASVRLNIRFEKLFEPIPIEGYREEFRMAPVTFEVAEKLPDGYLQAKYDPQVAALIAETVRMSVSNKTDGTWNRIGKSHEIDLGYLPRLVIKEPLPVDLAFCARWHIKETGKSYEGGWRTMVAGDRTRARFSDDFRGPTLSFPYALSDNPDDMAQLGEQFTVRITLEPSLKAALWHPDIKSYWPRPIELPEFTVRIRKNEKADSK